MHRQMSSAELKILQGLQNGLPATPTPYQDLAKQIKVETGELLNILRKWKQEGKLRRIGAVVNHFKVGFTAGALVIWRVEPERIDEVATKLARFKEVSHAYERTTADNWPYNVYTMVHGESKEHLNGIIKRMSEACGVTNYRVLATEKELKKTPPRYIHPRSTNH